ncbi:MAG TPA: phosphopantothenate/pantothenate synthetase [Thermoplasmatales archaeon]|nr:phosphopantothenate/pantothenate synthetase [Thermoplasmatales archaeon]
MIPPNHPRYKSLMLRSIIEEGVRNGIVHPTGLIAHGRGEAFDYLIGEKTQKFAENAIKAGVAYLKIAENPVISVNGNTAVLCAEEIVKLAEKIKAKIEVNLFHRSEERIKKIILFLEEKGGKDILGLEGDAKINGLNHGRAICSYDGIYSGDVILVPLEDGDRCEALKKMGKIVITVDLNPLSRTARNADVTIVDNVVRVIPTLIKQFEKIKNPEEIIERWNNEKNLQIALDFICKRLRKIYRSHDSLNLL